MKIAFTICSNNYLAQAKVLGDSLLQKDPNYKFVIGLCDEFSDAIDYTFFENIEIIPVAKINIYCFEEIIKKYHIVELNTSIKPSFFKYFIEKYDDLESIIYFDPDIQIFNDFYSIEEFLKVNDILLTPHILKPVSVDNLKPVENTFLNFGIYNLGFIALNPKSKNTSKLLNWWEERTLKIGFDKVCDGLFVDQLWINLVPLFFDKVKIIRELGFNVAPWNLHERNNIKKIDQGYLMEDNSKLIFYHFSSYNYKTPNILSKYYNRYDKILLSSEVNKLYSQYHEKLIKNKVDEFSKIDCFYSKEEISKIEKRKSVFTILKNNLLPPIVLRLLRK
ncbi:hypothetical protein Q4Q34_01170 [Flavivirga abyssicola]|uniref:hypothetical protein n=1 Tax=Flavivirga abyssicola TaxID=3063533 RepID=UPI0026DEF260|nr:hypothetical protein [Flavivirga sp. MEBiC07777]WVK13649.1 hypothetical protein Q4Q34_01170 [Flavivirga sp. MEBiC07777]